MVGWSTQGGDKEAAQMSMELNWCMQEGLEEAGMATLEEVPTTSACPMIHDYLTYQPGVQGWSYVYGTEYQTGGPWVGPLSAVHDHNVPCAVCYASTRVAVTMIPAKTAVLQHGLWSTLAT